MESTMSITIRAIRLKDARGFRACVGVVAQERRYLSFFEPFPLSAVRAFIGSNLRRKFPALVVVDGDQVVGWADITGPLIEGPHAHVGILGMGLLPEYRGNGLGRKLITRALAAARNRFDKVELSVFRKNRNARALYRSVGFELCGVRKQSAKLCYGFDDVLLMEKCF
jgi:ribosomal protein S18 acetylase RimI-like enzyme